MNRPLVMHALLLLLASQPSYKLAFCKEGDIWTIWPDGTHEQKIAETFKFEGKGMNRPLVTSPDHKTLVYWDHAAGHWDLISCDAEGKKKRTLTKDLDGGCRSARFSNDGKWIAFMCDQPNGLYVMKSDGSAKRRLSEVGHRDNVPVWSPDGKWIAWVDETPAGERNTYVTNVATPKAVLVGKGSRPAWMDSQTLMFSGGKWSLVDRRVVPSDLTMLALHMHVSPQGKWWLTLNDSTRIPMAFMNERNSHRTVWSSKGGSLRTFAWSPDDRYFAYYRGNTLRVVELNAESVTETTVASDAEYLVWLKR